MRSLPVFMISLLLFSCQGTKEKKDTEIVKIELPAGYNHIIVPFDTGSKKRILQFPNYGNVLIEIYEGNYMDSGVIVHSKPIALLKPNNNDSIQLDVTDLKPGKYRMDYFGARYGGSRFVLELKIPDDK